ncbi:hypothetical protein PENARI_c038G03958 [Penicillium arizonense]|uniref:Uncharacterized protein n=1 Tax=Penicillium arizonense TaxID=1835702 RepID=A0A1F5L481_PENAI|nr:hypothetical protein PENARI_c038G03958 [Penicillium arizonense]OGE47721.1 hypothetical protein PENARI_c038G03958 [Penicillium arizonense]
MEITYKTLNLDMDKEDFGPTIRVGLVSQSAPGLRGMTEETLHVELASEFFREDLI